MGSITESRTITQELSRLVSPLRNRSRFWSSSMRSVMNPREMSLLPWSMMMKRKRTSYLRHLLQNRKRTRLCNRLWLCFRVRWILIRTHTSHSLTPMEFTYRTLMESNYSKLLITSIMLTGQMSTNPLKYRKISCSKWNSSKLLSTWGWTTWKSR